MDWSEVFWPAVFDTHNSPAKPMPTLRAMLLAMLLLLAKLILTPMLLLTLLLLTSKHQKRKRKSKTLVKKSQVGRNSTSFLQCIGRIMEADTRTQGRADADAEVE